MGVKELVNGGHGIGSRKKSGLEAVEDDIQRDLLVLKGKVHSNRHLSGSLREARFKEGLSPPQGPTAGPVKSLHLAAMRKPAFGRRFTQGADPLCHERLGGKGIRDGGPDVAEEAGNCGGACGAPKGGFARLRGRKRKPRYPSLRGCLPDRGRGNAVFRWSFARSMSMGRRQAFPRGRPESTRLVQGAHGSTKASRSGEGHYGPFSGRVPTQFDDQDFSVFLGRAPALHILRRLPARPLGLVYHLSEWACGFPVRPLMCSQPDRSRDDGGPLVLTAPMGVHLWGRDKRPKGP